MSTLPTAPMIDHGPWKAPKSDKERREQEEKQKRYDMMSGWRGADGSGKDSGGLLGTEIMKTGRGIDWFADNQPRSRESVYAGGPPQLEDGAPAAATSSGARTVRARPRQLAHVAGPRGAARAARLVVGRAPAACRQVIERVP